MNLDLRCFLFVENTKTFINLSESKRYIFKYNNLINAKLFIYNSKISHNM